MNSAPQDDPGETAKWLSHPPFYDFLGMSLLSLHQGRCVLRLNPRRELTNSKGEIHGGPIAACLDIAMSQAVRSSYTDKVNVATISMTVNYLEASQGALTVTAKVVRAGKTVAYAEAKAVNEAMGLMAKVSATFRIIR